MIRRVGSSPLASIDQSINRSASTFVTSGPFSGPSWRRPAPRQGMSPLRTRAG